MSEKPLLTLCIPTYNRAETLNQLLADIADIKSIYGELVEVCISNNASTDTTGSVIERWRSLFEIFVWNQSVNVGATSNLQRVSSMAHGKWILIVGDDDGLNVPAFKPLMDILVQLCEEYWIIARVKDRDGNVLYFRDFESGLYSPTRFMSKLVTTDLSDVGFIGSHIFPGRLVTNLLALRSSDVRPWPHVALLFQSLGTCNFFLTECAPVIQSAFGQNLVWSPRDWIHARLRLVSIFVRLVTDPYVPRHNVQRVGKRHIRSRSFMKELVRWRIVEPRNFRLEADAYLRSQLSQLDIQLPRLNSVCLTANLLAVLGDPILTVTLRVVGKAGAPERWRSQILPSDQNAAVRGL